MGDYAFSLFQDVKEEERSKEEESKEVFGMNSLFPGLHRRDSQKKRMIEKAGKKRIFATTSSNEGEMLNEGDMDIDIDKMYLPQGQEKEQEQEQERVIPVGRVAGTLGMKATTT